MARGGYIQPEIAVKKLFSVTGVREKARRIIVDALISGALATKGRQLLQWKCDPFPKGQLRDLARQDPSLEAVLGDIAEIPSSYWLELDEADVRDADWKHGYFRARYENHHGYQDVVLKEKDINILVGLHKPNSIASPKPKERLRQPSWDDWVAAIAILAAEQRLSGKMKNTELLGLVDTKLASWGLEGKEVSTISPTASAIIRRFRENPPVKPIG